MKLSSLFMYFAVLFISLVSSAAIIPDGVNPINNPAVEACDDLCVTAGHCNQDACCSGSSPAGTLQNCGNTCVDGDNCNQISCHHCDEDKHIGPCWSGDSIDEVSETRDDTTEPESSTEAAADHGYGTGTTPAHPHELLGMPGADHRCGLRCQPFLTRFYCPGEQCGRCKYSKALDNWFCFPWYLPPN